MKLGIKGLERLSEIIDNYNDMNTEYAETRGLVHDIYMHERVLYRKFLEKNRIEKGKYLETILSDKK